MQSDLTAFEPKFQLDLSEAPEKKGLIQGCLNQTLIQSILQLHLKFASFLSKLSVCLWQDIPSHFETCQCWYDTLFYKTTGTCTFPLMSRLWPPLPYILQSHFRLRSSSYSWKRRWSSHAVVYHEGRDEHDIENSQFLTTSLPHVPRTYDQWKRKTVATW